MASVVYNSMLDDLVNGNINFKASGGDTYYLMLVTDVYSVNKDTHTRRNNITNEVANGNGYATGGKQVTVTNAVDTALDQENLTFGTVTWPTATITARGAVIYKLAGGTLPGTAANDPLVAYIDFGQNVSSTNANFAVSFSSPLRFQN